MHGVSPTRQSPVPSTSTSSIATSTAAVASSSLPAKNNCAMQQQIRPSAAAAAANSEQQHHRLGRHSGGIYVENHHHQGNKRLAVHLADSGTERVQQQSMLSSPVECNSRKSPADMDTAAGNNNLLLMEAQRHFPIQQTWNVLNNLALSRASMSHHLAAAPSREFESDTQQQQHQQQMMAHKIHQQQQEQANRSASHFAYPQLLNATKDRLALPATPSIDPKRLVPHNFSAHTQQQQLSSAFKHHQQQSAPVNFASSASQMDRESYPQHQQMTTYLRPMPPLIPVTAGPLLATAPTSLRSNAMEQQRSNHNNSSAGHSSAADSSAAVPPALRPLDGSTTIHGPPRKSSRFRGGESSTGDGESSDSRSSSASSSPLLMLTDVLAEATPLPDPLRSTSVIRFAHRPNSSPPPPSSK